MKETQECRVCRRRSSIDDPPINLVLKNMCKSFLKERNERRSSGSDEICSLHSEKLKLFCLEDKQPVCLVCRDSQQHENHKFRPIGEVVSSYKEEIDTTLKSLRKKLKHNKNIKGEFEKTVQHIKSQAEHTKHQIKQQFEKLHQFLRDEEEATITALREEEEQKKQMMKEKLEEINRHISDLLHTIKDMEKMKKANDVCFLKSLRYQPPLFPWDGEPSDVPAVDHWFRESERVWDSAHLQLQRALRRRRLTADLRQSQAPVYQPGDKVWLSTRDIRMRLPCKKLSPRFIGPYTILRQINPVTYQLQLPPEVRIHPTFHVSLLKSHHPSVLPSTEPGDAEEPPPIIVEDGAVYLVKEVLDSHRRGGHLEYLVDWERYGPEERSWVPRVDILDPSLLEDFHARHPNRPAPRGRGRPPRRRGPWSSGVDRGGGVMSQTHQALHPANHVTLPHQSTDHMHLTLITSPISSTI
ncbi:Tripartite motif-containing protein 35 [Anabarilius grahami]|uniref:Tripartite motif-containing protein 35 n=1 Tax=Anabarilius grahami TaxID=495550 RepID=A0A3N0XLW4_ANAGA|nr:Tripartite motif-containing protein 35 [Anabarilius grahami]